MGRTWSIGGLGGRSSRRSERRWLVVGPERLESVRMLSATPPEASVIDLLEWQGRTVEARVDRWVGQLASGFSGAEAGAVTLVAELSAAHPDWRATTLGGGYFSLAAPAATTADVVGWAADTPAVTSIEPDLAFRAAAIPNDPSFPSQWALRNVGQNGGLIGADIRATQAWDVTTGSRSVVIGIVDSGIDVTHPDLAANIWINPGEIAGNGLDDDHNGYVDDVHGWNFVDNTNLVDDGFGHGTHVAGIVGAVGNNGIGIAGVSWQVSLMALKFQDSRGIGSTSSMLAALNYATMMRRDHGINVVATNNSWQSVGGASPVVQQAISAHGDAGIMFVAAAGNNGTDSDVTPRYPGSYRLPNVITVAATNGDNALAGLSNYGATSVDLGAPGIMIQSTFPNAAYGILSGTSMAAPQVTGVVALLNAAKPGISVAEVRAAILGSTTPVASLAGKTVTGGRVDARAALDALHLPWVAAPAPSPTAPPAAPTRPLAPIVVLSNDSGISDVDHITNDGRLAVSGVEDGNRLEFSANLGRTWTDSFTPRSGINTVSVRQTNPAGLRSPTTVLKFTLDVSAPVAPRVSLASDTGRSSLDRITRIGTLRVACERRARVEYSTDDGQTWSDTFTPIEGINAVRTRQTDLAGNVSPTSTALAFTLLTGSPQVVGMAAPELKLIGTTQVLDVAVTFSRPVRVAARPGVAPSIDLLVGTQTVRATYVAGSGGMQLLFRLRLTAGNVPPAEGYRIVDGIIRLPAGTWIQDFAGNRFIPQTVA